MKRKINSDNEGISAMSILIILSIVISLWQIGMPYIDEDIPIPTDISTLWRPNYEDVETTFKIQDRNTNQFTILTGQTFPLDSDSKYSLIFETNAPYSIISEPYILVIEIDRKPIAETVYEQVFSSNNPVPYDLIFGNTFSYSLDLNYDYDYIIWFWIYTPDGRITNNPSGLIGVPFESSQ